MEKLTEKEIKAFISGVQETFECGDTIDKRKELEWVVNITDTAYLIKAIWFCGEKKSKSKDPQLDTFERFTDDYSFKLIIGTSTRKWCAEILNAIDEVNKQEYFYE